MHCSCPHPLGDLHPDGHLICATCGLPYRMIVRLGPIPARKPRPDLLPARGLLIAGQVMADGADEHGERWRTRTARHHVACGLRHLLRWLAGDRVDESGHSHLAHAATRLLMATDLEPEEPRP